MNIKVSSDYDGAFESWVKAWVNKKQESKQPFKHETIVISAGPYRSYAVSFESKDKELHLDFYSALRNGFGSLSAQDVADIIELL